MRLAIFAGLGLLWQVSSASADAELKNDGFNTGDIAGFESGFAAGEMGASRFVAPDAGRTLLKVQLIFGGGSTATQMVTLHAYDDSGGTDSPGSQLYQGDFGLTGSDTAIQEIATTDMTVTLPQQFRVAIEFHHAGAPSIARDSDGTIAADKNYLFSNSLGWTKSTTFGLAGDWIIRAFVSGDGGVPVGGNCTGNPDCPAGQFCDTAIGSCTFECRVDPDCGGGACNSLGQCVGGDGSGGGCCRTDQGGGETAAIFGAGLLGLLVLRRRRCA